MCYLKSLVRWKYAPVDIAAGGVIVSTPAGSTAYSLSGVVSSDIPVLQLVPNAIPKLQGFGVADY